MCLHESNFVNHIYKELVDDLLPLGGILFSRPQVDELHWIQLEIKQIPFQFQLPSHACISLTPPPSFYRLSVRLKANNQR